ncbi:TPA: replication initiation factor domain-containing protein [Streptococcus agalactiae]|nr:replication initiation factor domain-containing protein [Streptococcus agalactiae]HEN7902897.1 replication initiation factor domain-containing protein [Streptococcus agalactiae]
MDKLNPIQLKKFRHSLKLTQAQFAKTVGISHRTYRSYEDGSRGLSLEKFSQFKQALGFYAENDKERIETHIDYLRMTFMSIRDLEHFCLTYLHFPFSEFSEFETRLLNYTRLWKRGNIWLFDFFDKIETGNNQVTLQLSGQGCREMELILDSHQETWQIFLQRLLFNIQDCRVTRLDIAMDERYLGQDNESQHFYLSDMITKVYKEEVEFKYIKTWNHIGGGHLKQSDTSERSHGISLYFGSRQSNLYFNFYEKRYDLAKKENLTLQEALEIFGIWNRYELRLSHEKAQLTIEEYINGIDLAEIARGIINDHMQVYDGTNTYGAFMPDQKWQALFGGTEPLKLRMKPEPYSIDRTVRWLMYQVANSLKLVEEADKIMATDYLKLIKESGEITDRAEIILKDLKASYASF